MNAPAIRDPEILIVGAGPIGLVLALWLTRLGVRVRIVDQTAEPGTSSRAVGVQARTLELYNQIGLADEVVARGRKAPAANLWVTGKKAARFFFGDMGADISPFPYALVFPQDEHESLLVDRLATLGVVVERRTELLSFEEKSDRVFARLKLPDGTLETCATTFIAGCDGAHSTVREQLKIGFAGGTYAARCYVADVEASGEAMNGEMHVAVDKTDFLVIFPLKAEGRARLIGTVHDDAEHRHEQLTWNDVRKRVIEGMHLKVERVNWFSTYRVHHRVADHFRQGRAFLLGDAAHIHSPVGGQGLNAGIGDAVNLAWKLAAVLRSRADASLLDSYEPERIVFARKLVATTDRVFAGVTSSKASDRFMRLNIVPFLMPLLFKFAPVRHSMFRAISQAAVNYRGSFLSEGRVGAVHGGDRLPWLKTELNGFSDNFAPLTSLDWQVHIYGAATPEILAACAEQKLPLHVFPWRSEMNRTGLRRNAVYLLRPDGYVGMVSAAARATSVADYFAARKLSPMPVTR
jgi:2-polyprenyl-6-methoxyphenol hydroxylase-like FAD-dependent oxidoreductase